MGQIFALMAGLVLTLISLLFVFRFILKRNTKKLLNQNLAHDGLTKKQPLVDVNQYSTLFFNLGAILTLGVCYLIFELKQYEEREVIGLESLEKNEESILDVPITNQPPPLPPPVFMPEIIAVDNEQKIDENIKIDVSSEPSEDVSVEKSTRIEVVIEEVKEEIDETFTIVEEPAKPIGDYPAFYKYVQKSLNYPSQAKRMGVEGKVYIQFVVDKDGSLTEVKVMKGIGAGCDEEAARVIKESPKWAAGKQRGKPVKQRIVMPITFKLG